MPDEYNNFGGSVALDLNDDVSCNPRNFGFGLVKLIIKLV